MAIVALIPLRGGSKSIPLKNIKPLAGHPLCHWSIRACLDTDFIDQVWVATDHSEIEQEARRAGAQIFHRSPESSSDTAPTTLVIDEFLEAHPEVETLVLVQATSPLTCPQELTEAYQQYQREGSTGLVTCVRQHLFRWSPEGESLNYQPISRPRRQDWSGELYEDGSFYFLNTVTYQASRCIPPQGKISVYQMPRERHLEIDDPIDFLVIELLLRHGMVSGHLRDDLRIRVEEEKSEELSE